jgi:hypothetical protein
MGWYVLAAVLLVSSLLNAIQVAVVDETQTQILRASLSLVMLFLAPLALRKGMADTDASR